MPLETWIALITLGFTIINAIIAGILVPIYLNNKIVKTQKQIIQFQDEITKKSQLVSLKTESTTPDSFINGFQINNNGLVSAQNVRISIYSYYDGSDEDILVYKIEDFNFLPSSNAVNIKTEVASNLTSRNSRGTSGILFTIDLLPPNFDVGFFVTLKNGVPKQTYVLQDELKITLATYLRNLDVKLFKYDIERSLRWYYAGLFSAGRFVGDVSCNNSGGESGEVGFIVPAIESFAFNIQEIRKDSFTASLKVQYFEPLHREAKEPTTLPIPVTNEKGKEFLLHLKDEKDQVNGEKFEVFGGWNSPESESFSAGWGKFEKEERERRKALKSRYRLWKWVRWI